MGRKATPLPITLRKLKQHYLAGETAQELAALCGVTDKIIYARLKGVKKRPTYHKGECLENDCCSDSDKRGYCDKHYRRRQARGEFSTKKCSVDRCGRYATTKGMCPTHYQRVRRGHALEAPIKTPAPRGSGYINSDGYRCFGSKKEHRLVVEQVLGRLLCRDENVHHINGDRADNRPKNLELWVNRRQPKGQRVSDAVEAAVEVLLRYAPELLVVGSNAASQGSG